MSPASIRLTEQPSNAMTQAYSQPIGPAPTTARLFGMSVRPHERVGIVDAVAIELELGRVVRA